MIKARQQLDIVLKYMYDKKDKVRAIDIDEIKAQDSLLKMAGNKSELEGMIIKLRDDKYVQIYPDYYRLPDDKQDMKRGMFTFCNITFDGRLFFESGCYVEQEITTSKIENRKDRREKHLLWGTWGVAFGAVALVVWDMYKTLCISPLNSWTKFEIHFSHLNLGLCQGKGASLL